MIFAAPIAGVLAGILGAIVVVLLYMLKLRRRPVPVSSTMLWMSAVRDMEGNIPWQAARPTVLMIMHLLIVALLALAIARPSIGADASAQRLIFVIDTSASMKATIDASGTTRFEQTKKQATDVIRSATRGFGSPELIVFSVGQAPKLLAGPTRRGSKAIRAINAMVGTDEPGDISSVHEQIEVLLNTPIDEEQGNQIEKSTILMYTDRAGSVDAPERIAGVGVQMVVDDAEPMSNVGITALSAQRDRADPSLCRVFVRAYSTDPNPVGVIIRVLDGETELARAALAFEGAGSSSKTIEVRLAHAGELQVHFDRPDALASDDHAWVWIPDPSPARVVVVADGTGHPILLDVLGAITNSSITVIGPDDPIPAWAQLIVADGVKIAQNLTIPTIRFGPGIDAGEQGETPRVHQIISYKRAHPVLFEVAMGSVAYTHPSVLVASTDSSSAVLASDSARPAMIERANAGVRHLAFCFDLDRSNWTVQIGFTIFLANAVEYLVPGASGFGEVTKTGEFYPRVTNRTAVVVEDSRSVSLLDEQETNLSAAAAADAGGESDERIKATQERVSIRRPIWNWFLLGAFALMAGEWFLHASRLRV